MHSRRIDWGRTTAGHDGIKTVTIQADEMDVSIMKLSCHADLESIEVEEGNPKYTSDKGVLYTKDMGTLLFYPRAREDQLFYVPGSVTRIGYGAFAGAQNLMRVMLPQSVASIGEKAFIYAEKLRSVNIPDAVESIEYATFFGCGSLTDVSFGSHPHLKEIMAKAFSLCESLSFLQIPSVTHIGALAFDGCASLRYLMFNTQQNIEPAAFRETLIMLPDSLLDRRAELMWEEQQPKRPRTEKTQPPAIRGEVRTEKIMPGDPEYPPDDYSPEDGEVPTDRIIIETKEDDGSEPIIEELYLDAEDEEVPTVKEEDIW